MTAVGACRSRTSRGMSDKRHSRPEPQNTAATVFAALGDETRLSVLKKLCNGQPLSISRLTADTHLSRQAVTKHLGVLTRAGVVRNVRVGRENLFALEPQPLAEVRDILDRISKEWDNALARLKAHVQG